jgi:hypothetical protein
MQRHRLVGRPLLLQQPLKLVLQPLHLALQGLQLLPPVC